MLLDEWSLLPVRIDAGEFLLFRNIKLSTKKNTFQAGPSVISANGCNRTIAINGNIPKHYEDLMEQKKHCYPAGSGCQSNLSDSVGMGIRKPVRADIYLGRQRKALNKNGILELVWSEQPDILLRVSPEAPFGFDKHGKRSLIVSHKFSESPPSIYCTKTLRWLHKLLSMRLPISWMFHFIHPLNEITMTIHFIASTVRNTGEVVH